MTFRVNVGFRSRNFLIAFRTIDWSIGEDPPISSAINLALHLSRSSCIMNTRRDVGELSASVTFRLPLSTVKVR